MRDDVIDGIRCMLMRGGTSKGAYFLADDLPVDTRDRNDLLLRVLGSPDPRQIDGIGGAHPLTSKVAVVTPSPSDDVDLDYLFLQVGVEETTVSESQTCGNLLAGVGPFAVERGLVRPTADSTTVRIRLLNTGAIAQETFSTDGARPVYVGDQEIDGVPGRAAPIDITVEAGAKPLFPTGAVAEEIGGRRVTLADNGMPVVLLEAADFGLTGTEDPADLEARTVLTAELATLRLVAGERFGLGDVTAQTVPKMALVSEPRSGGAVTTRTFIPHRVHDAIGVLMGATIAAAVQVPGTVGSHVAAPTHSGSLNIEHPSGATPFDVAVQQDPNGVWHATSHSVRTARKLFDGLVFPRPALDNGVLA